MKGDGGAKKMAERCGMQRVQPAKGIPSRERNLASMRFREGGILLLEKMNE